jgi:hypothetical protein
LRIVNAKKQTYQGDKEYSNYIIEYESPTKGKYLYLGVSVYEEGNMLLISAFDAKVSETSLAEIHSFSFAKREFAHYLFIAFAILVPLFIITTLAFAIRTRLSRKWLWIVAILFGFVKFTINWTTGQLGFQMIGFQLLGAGLSRQGLVGPWTLSFTIPVMAIYFWIKRYWDNRDSELMLRYNERQKVTT